MRVRVRFRVYRVRVRVRGVRVRVQPRLVEDKVLRERVRLVQRVRIHHHDLLMTVRALSVHLTTQRGQGECWVVGGR